MLGLDLRRVKKGDELYNIIANKEVIALNQDELGIQAKRIKTTAKNCNATLSADKDYITDCDRIDILAKPLSDGNLAISFFNLSENDKNEKVFCNLELIKKFLGNKLPEKFYNAKKFFVKNLWSKETWAQTERIFEIDGICGCGNVTLKICIEE